MRNPVSVPVNPAVSTMLWGTNPKTDPNPVAMLAIPVTTDRTATPSVSPKLIRIPIHPRGRPSDGSIPPSATPG
jgi:hypothetical protein